MMTLDWYVWLPLMVGCFGCGYGMGNMDSRKQLDDALNAFEAEHEQFWQDIANARGLPRSDI